MTTATESTLHHPRTLGDLLNQLGGVSADRVRLIPSPGTATEQDAINNPLCDLVDGTLVEKPLGFNESVLAVIIARVVANFVVSRKLGLVAITEGMFRVSPGQIRMPDVSYTSWARIPHDVQSVAAPDLSPDLAIEILSPANTLREMERKRQDYFDGGTRLIWIVHPEPRTVDVYLPGQSEPAVLSESDSLDGFDVLPGFYHSIAAIFAEAQRPAEQVQAP
jgi:Uma2 family endonuclease